MYTQVVAWKVELFIEGNMKDKKHLFLFGYYKGLSNDSVGFVLEAVKKIAVMKRGQYMYWEVSLDNYVDVGLWIMLDRKLIFKISIFSLESF